jgi:hypothetical protein
VDLGRRGRKRQLELEDAYWRLVLAGVGTVEACRAVGIGRKTGCLGVVDEAVDHGCGYLDP